MIQGYDSRLALRALIVILLAQKTDNSNKMEEIRYEPAGGFAKMKKTTMENVQ